MGTVLFAATVANKIEPLAIFSLRRETDAVTNRFFYGMVQEGLSGFPHLQSFVSVVIAASGMFSGDGERLLVRRQMPSVKAKLCSVVRVPDGVILKTVPALLAPPLNVVP